MVSPDCLKILAKASSIDDLLVNNLTKVVWDHLLASAHGKILTRKNGDSNQDLYVALGVLILESAKINISDEDLTKTLTGCSWSSLKIAEFVAEYNSRKKTLQSLMTAFSSVSNNVNDVDWRLDLRMLDNGRIGELLYAVDLTTETSKARESLKFCATVLELEDLVCSLKEACQSLKYNANLATQPM